jgi:UDP-N-acetylmuramoyl-L-alanyl-D-glutamate--2,6-diaminopimelate ligase
MASRSEPGLSALFARFADLDIPFARDDADGDDPIVTDVVLDSRRVRPGALFCCVPGDQFDGHDFAAAAVDAGAAALLVDRVLDLDVPQVQVEAVRPAMAHAAAAFFGHPSEQLSVVGITGTNGKTTVAAFVAGIVRSQGRSAAVIGTLGGERTTPEAPELQRLLANSVARGDDVVAMEVSSHSLDQARVDGTRFAVAVFTNLSQDHLDYHGDMDRYYEAKATLFVSGRASLALINEDDSSGRRLLGQATVPARPYGIGDAEILEETSFGSRFRWREQEINLPIAGRFNVLNAVAAAETAVDLGIEPEAVASGLSAATAIPGRFEVLTADPFTVVVDYAHTPDALEQVLLSARVLAGPHRVVLVFGAGGDRDQEKRPLMGAAAERGADDVFVTSDNPRSEAPQQIIDEIRAGMTARARATMVEERSEAIDRALSAARPGDVVVIAGKGHETTQTIGDNVVNFDDRVVARALLEELNR